MYHTWLRQRNDIEAQHFAREPGCGIVVQYHCVACVCNRRSMTTTHRVTVVTTYLELPDRTAFRPWFTT
ncbi:MAG: hypothetical protein ACP5MJ_15035, partial [Roseiflexus sp.]